MRFAGRGEHGNSVSTAAQSATPVTIAELEFPTGCAVCTTSAVAVGVVSTAAQSATPITIAELEFPTGCAVCTTSTVAVGIVPLGT